MIKFDVDILSSGLAFVYCSALIVGIIMCKKFSIKPAFYFFIILTVEFVYRKLLSYYSQDIIDSHNLPFGLTIGEFLAYSAILAEMIQLTAYAFLVVGLYVWWRKNPEQV